MPVMTRPAVTPMAWVTWVPSDARALIPTKGRPYRFRIAAWQAAKRQACLQNASAPDVPFCAAGWMAMAVVLARCSAPGRVCSIAGSRTVDGAHRFGCRKRFSMFSGRAGGLRACSCSCARHQAPRSPVISGWG